MRILLVEDDAETVRLVRSALKREEVVHVGRLDEAVDALAGGRFDAVILDLTLPDSDGPGASAYLALRDAPADVPVVVLSDREDDEAAAEAVSAGAQDHVVRHPFEPGALLRALRYAVERHQLIAELQRLVLVDELTGLANRRGFAVLGGQLLRSAARAGSTAGVLYADLDGVERISSRFGREEGDRAVQEAADLLRRTFRSADVIARVGGEEFAVLFSVAEAAGVAEAVARLRSAVAERNASSGSRYELELTFGSASMSAEDVSSLDALVSEADRAMYELKLTRER